MSTNFKHLQRKQKTRTSFNPILGKLQIDRVAVYRPSKKEIINVKILRGTDSDHYLTKIQVRLISTKKR